MYDAYSAHLHAPGPALPRRAADTGAIGGSASQEFHVLADSGEDAIAFSRCDDYAANLELAEALPPRDPRAAAPERACARSRRPARARSRTSRALLKVPAAQLLKTLVVDGARRRARRAACCAATTS